MTGRLVVMDQLIRVGGLILRQGFLPSENSHLLYNFQIVQGVTALKGRRFGINGNGTMKTKGGLCLPGKVTL